VPNVLLVTDIRNTCQPISPLTQLGRSPRLARVIWARLSIPQDREATGMQSLGPVGSTLQLLERLLLALEVLLRYVRSGAVVRVKG